MHKHFKCSAFTYCTEELPSRMDVHGKAQVWGTIHYKASRRCESFLGHLESCSFNCTSISKQLRNPLCEHLLSLVTFLLKDNSTVHPEIHFEGVARLVMVCFPLCWLSSSLARATPVWKNRGLVTALHTTSSDGMQLADMVGRATYPSVKMV